MNLENNPVAKLNSDLLTVRQTSEFLNLTISQVRSLIFKRQLPVLKLGGCVRVSMEDLKVWLNEKRKQSQAI